VLPDGTLMVGRSSSRLFLLIFGAGYLCAAQAERITALKWSHYYADLYAVPQDLVDAIIEAESAWEPNAVSPKGAAGLMQLMPATAVTFGVTNRFEIEQNVRAGVAYLAHLLTAFRGDVRLVAAAYISGERRIISSGLHYSNAAVFDYVRKVVRRYEHNRLKRFSSQGQPDAEIRGGNFP
jgi:soluble lytic murein transglycosylase-like protein